MRQLTSILFAVLYLVAMLRPVQPIVHYYINQDYIATFLCINEDKPDMHCDGKCYLMEQLEKQDPQKNNHAPNIQLENYPIGFVYIYFLEKNRSKPDFSPKVLNTYHNDYSYLYQTSTFHPPQV